MNFSKKILELRKSENLSQDDMAEFIGVSRQTISSWENARSYPDLEVLVKISDKFSISLDELLKEVNLESSFLIFTALLYGLPISYFVVHFLMKVSSIHKYNGKVYMPFPTLYAIIAVASLTILVLIIMLYNYNKLKKKNIIEAIREEI